MTADAEEMGRRGKVGGFALAAMMTPEQRRENARRAVQARWAKENARRAAAGEPPTRKTTPALDDDALSYWLAEVDRQFPDYPWKYPQDRKRQAIALARQAAARAAAQAFSTRAEGA